MSVTSSEAITAFQMAISLLDGRNQLSSGARVASYLRLISIYLGSEMSRFSV